MIKFVEIEANSCPIIFCDSCGEKISKAREAAVVFNNFPDDNQPVPVLYVHKDFVKENCLKKAEKIIRDKGQKSGWMELSYFLAYLVKNAGMNPKDIEDELKSQ